MVSILEDVVIGEDRGTSGGPEGRRVVVCEKEDRILVSFCSLYVSPLLYLSLRNLYHLHTAHASVASKREGAFFDKFDLELCDRSKPCNRFLSLNTQLLPIATFSCFLSRFTIQVGG